MRTLYESILDDEDVLISNVKKQSNNWLLNLKYLMLNNASKQDILDFLNSELVKKDIKPLFKKLDNAYWELHNADNEYYSTFCTLYGGSARSVSKSPALINILPKDKYLTIVINKPKNIITSIRKNVNEETLLNFYKVIEEMGGKPVVNAEKSIYRI